MKIDASKNHPVDRKESKNVYRTERSVFNNPSPLKSAPEHPAPAPGAFAKILEEARGDNEKNGSSTIPIDSAEPDSKTTGSEKGKETGRTADRTLKLEERNPDSRDGDAMPNGDENQAPQFAPANLPPVAIVNSETIPAARSILHVADLERIIATIRAENFQNQKQITIALKNSVLEGLQIKLTVTENGKLKAEFLALNKQIKSRLERRKKELSEILHNRAPLFSEIEITAQE